MSIKVMKNAVYKTVTNVGKKDRKLNIHNIPRKFMTLIFR